MTMKIWHLFHSGVLVETESVQLFFDVITDIDTLIHPQKKLYFFVSHGHSDHFSMKILKSFKDKAQFILSDEAVIREAFIDCDQTLFVKPNEVHETLPFKISTYDSTDLGVSFLIELDQKTLFHSGDLNWWHWENATQEVQADEARQFKEIVDSIQVDHIDIAFIPVDPRLKDAYNLSAAYFLSEKHLNYLIPIHFNEDYEITERLYSDLKNDRIIQVKAKHTMVLTLE
ncbi:MBL fold metallo-hydrolase [Fusibacter ferrireducens]|uniref:MBL fold metallo-hydrolase n=1 Tax=Fusibacter ferrireducens TaxID=2785058 RepID=A0ABR9ZQ70_9FIRM|nr:MBL fold metallo-hydrolase [Fusibacter ferrireducens]MBF4692612.1 MBL fold metallo-hydrolase [Fusibacter ferrireducens]